MNKQNSEVDENAYVAAVKQLQQAHSVGHSLPDIVQIWNAKDRVLARFGKVFAPDNIPNLTADDYYEFLRFENNGHWSGLSRSAKGAAVDMDKLRAVLAHLLDESLPIADRIDATFGKISGLNRAVLTPILLIVYPDRYGVWNAPAEAALKQAGLWPAGNASSNGAQYEKINAVLQRLAVDLETDLWTLDSLWWFMMQQQEADARRGVEIPGTSDEDVDEKDEDDEEDVGLAIDRQNVTTARDLIEKWIPDPEHRVAVLETIADAVDTAHGAKPSSWGITLTFKALRLSVGALEALAIRKRPHRDGYFYVLLDLKSLSDSDFVALEASRCIRGDQVYKKQPGAIGMFVPLNEVGNVIPLIKHTALLPRVVAASKARLISTVARGHSPNVIEYLEEELDRRLPNPSYYAGADISSDARIWKIGPGEQGRLWEECLLEGLISSGWDQLGDLQGISKEEYFNRRDQTGYQSRDLQAWKFANEICVGDRIIANKGIGEILGIGTVTGPYSFTANVDHGHRIPVMWDDINSFRIDPVGNWRSTLIPVSREQYQAILLQYPPSETTTATLSPVQPPSPYTMEDAVKDLFMDEGDFLSIVNLMRAKKNVILQGAPGVGKTFIARRLAFALMGAKDSSRLEYVQFHQSYSYEDFIQGFRPREAGGFTLRDGVFYRFCKRAENDQERPYLFIIDEINRGNLSKIFGELLMLIETDKRGPDHSMPLLYSDQEHERFYVPKNVYILGMMNTADRSLAMVDYALRRRFAFVSLAPGFHSPKFLQYIVDHGVSGDLAEHLIAQMVRLNIRISADTANLGHGFCIGHSFFTPSSGTPPDAGWFAMVIEHEIEPLLREYYIDQDSEVDTMINSLRAGFC